MLDTFLVRIPELNSASLSLHRLGIFFAAPMSFSLFLLSYILPSQTITLPKKGLYVSVAATLLMMGLNLSPYAFIGVQQAQGFSEPQAGAGLLPFVIVSTVFAILALYFLTRSYFRSENETRRQLGTMLFGIIFLLGLIILTILVPLLFFETTFFLQFTPLYVLGFLGIIAYAITQYHLFDIKILLTQSLVVTIDIVLFGKLFAEPDINFAILDGLILFFMLIFGYFLVRSVNREVKQRELIEKQERELEVSNARLREIDKEKSEFLSFASHQLRTPLTAIRWSIDSIMDGTYGPLPDNLKASMKTLIDESSGMAVMINDYLDVSRIEQGRMQYQFGPVDLSVLVTEVGVELRPGVEKKGLQLEVSVPEEKVMVWGDGGKLKQVFSNIIDNATKYTPKGNISVTLRKMPGTSMAHVEVRDTGIGMSEETLKRMFIKFTRGDNAQEVNNNGSGLGLFIVKTFVESHHGTITAASEGVGKGTQFFVDIPLLVQTTS
jgi:signal transduction histidine kinase